MKILHCINSPSIGGIERLVIDLAVSQKERGSDVSIMLGTLEGQYYEYLIKQDIELLESNIKNGFDFSIKTYNKVLAVFNTFDIIHLHNFSVIRNASALRSKAKVIYTIHGLSKGIRKENRIKYFIREALKGFFLNRVDVIVANSNYTLALAKQHYSLKTIRSLTILNGVKRYNIIANHKESSISSPEIFTVGLVSRFTNRKRIDRLLKAFRLFLDSGNKGKLTLVGDGETFSEMNQLVKDLVIEDFVEFVGYKNNVADYYKEFDVLVFPSEKEPFGLVAVEAYFNGKPVLAFNDSGGLKEVVEPLEPKNIVNNESELAERLAYFSLNIDSIKENAKERIEYAKMNFSNEKMETDYFELYQELVQ
jgi:glycosyltransferase involved in cell wall biosynthesis